jgi:hypothetical protein
VIMNVELTIGTTKFQAETLRGGATTLFGAGSEESRASGMTETR